MLESNNFFSMNSQPVQNMQMISNTPMKTKLIKTNHNMLPVIAPMVVGHSPKKLKNINALNDKLMQPQNLSFNGNKDLFRRSYQS
jgi:hypothetical protein